MDQLDDAQAMARGRGGWGNRIGEKGDKNFCNNFLIMFVFTCATLGTPASIYLNLNPTPLCP